MCDTTRCITCESAGKTPQLNATSFGSNIAALQAEGKDAVATAAVVASKDSVALVNSSNTDASFEAGEVSAAANLSSTAAMSRYVVLRLQRCFLIVFANGVLLVLDVR